MPVTVTPFFVRIPISHVAAHSYDAHTHLATRCAPPCHIQSCLLAPIALRQSLRDNLRTVSAVYQCAPGRKATQSSDSASKVVGGPCTAQVLRFARAYTRSATAHHRAVSHRPHACRMGFVETKIGYAVCRTRCSRPTNVSRTADFHAVQECANPTSSCRYRCRHCRAGGGARS